MDTKMQNKIQEKIQELKVKNKYISTEWIERFFNMLIKTEVDEQTLNNAIELAFSEEMMKSYDTSFSPKKDGLAKNTKAHEVNDEFFKYMGKIGQEMGLENFREFLQDSINNMQKDYEKYKSEKHGQKTDFVKLFIRQLITKNPENLKMEASETALKDIEPESNYGMLDAVFAGFSVGHIKFEETKSNVPFLMFTDFRTLPGLERMGLGTTIFSSFCKEVKENKPKHGLVAVNVKKGRDGEKAYSAWGAYPIRVSFCENEEIQTQIETKPMSEKEYQATNSLCYYFPPQLVSKFSNKAIKQKNNEETLTK